MNEVEIMMDPKLVIALQEYAIRLEQVTSAVSAENRYQTKLTEKCNVTKDEINNETTEKNELMDSPNSMLSLVHDYVAKVIEASVTIVVEEIYGKSNLTSHDSENAVDEQYQSESFTEPLLINNTHIEQTHDYPTVVKDIKSDEDDTCHNKSDSTLYNEDEDEHVPLDSNSNNVKIEEGKTVSLDTSLSHNSDDDADNEPQICDEHGSKQTDMKECFDKCNGDVLNEDHSPLVDTLLNSQNDGNISFASMKPEPLNGGASEVSLLNHASVSSQTDTIISLESSCQTDTEFAECCKCGVFSLPMEAQVMKTLKDEMSQRMALDYLVKIVETECTELRQDLLKERNKTSQLEETIFDLKSKLSQAHALCAEYKTRSEELQLSVEGSQTMINKLEDKLAKTNYFKSGVDYMLESKLAETKAAEAQTKVEVLQQELLQSRQEVQMLLERLAEKNKERTDMISGAVHTELLRIADERAKDAEFKVLQLETELRQLKAKSLKSPLGTSPAPSIHTRDRSVTLPQGPSKVVSKLPQHKPPEPTVTSIGFELPDFTSSSEKDTYKHPSFPPSALDQRPGILKKTFEKPLLTNADSDDSDWSDSSDDSTPVTNVSKAIKFFHQQEIQPGSKPRAMTMPAPGSKRAKPTIPQKPKLPPKPTAHNSHSVMFGLGTEQEVGVSFDKGPASPSLGSVRRVKGQSGRRLPRRFSKNNLTQML